jgi:hypothetical protein
VHQNPILTQLAVRYQNDEMIGTQVMPTIMTDGQLSAQYFIHDSAAYFGVHDDTMAENGQPHEVSQAYTKGTVTLTARGLSALVDQAVIQNATEPLRPLMNATTQVLGLLELARESRIATAVMTAANYGVNTVAIAAADRWNTATGGDPKGDVSTALTSCYPAGPGTRILGVTSLAVYNVLQQHDRFLDRVKYTGADDDRMAVARWLGLDDLLVGKSIYDSANEGAGAMTMARLWSNSFAIVSVASTPMVEQASFGFSYQDLPTNAQQIFEDKPGVRGGYYCKAARYDGLAVSGPLSSYLLTTPIG